MRACAVWLVSVEYADEVRALTRGAVECVGALDGTLKRLRKKERTQ